MANLLTNELTNLILRTKNVVNKSLKNHESQLLELDESRKEVEDLETRTKRFGGAKSINRINAHSSKIKEDLDKIDTEIQLSILKDINTVLNEDVISDLNTSYQLIAYIETSDDSLKDFTNEFSLNYMLKKSKSKNIKGINRKLVLNVLSEDGTIKTRTTSQKEYVSDRDLFKKIKNSPSKILPRDIGDNYKLISSFNMLEFDIEREFNPFIISRLKSFAAQGQKTSRVAQKLTFGCLTNYPILGDFAAAKIIGRNISSMYSNQEIVESMIPKILEIDYKSFPSKNKNNYKTLAHKEMKEINQIAKFYEKNKNIVVSDDHQKRLASGIFLNYVYGPNDSSQELQLSNQDLFKINNKIISHDEYYEQLRSRRDYAKYKERNLDKIAPIVERIWMTGFNKAVELRNSYL